MRSVAPVPSAETAALEAETILQQIARQAADRPEALAVADPAAHLTFAQLDQQSNRLAAYLSEAGARRETCVGLLLERSAHFVIAALAAMKTGAAYLPLDPATPPERLGFILRDAGAPLLVTQTSAGFRAPDPCRTIEIDGSDARPIAAHPDATLESALDGEDLAYVIYTSGSTGEPKGVEITHANLSNLVSWHQQAFAVTPNDRASQVAGLGFDAAVWEIWPHLAAGASLHFADEHTRRSPQGLRDWLVDQKITISFVPTVLAEQLLHASWPRETALRTLLTGADALHRRPATGLPFVVVNNYGPTECTVVATSGIVAPAGKAEGAPSIGKPIVDTVALILDPSLRPVPPGEAGELCLGGTLVGRGYRNRPELTGSRFITYRAPGHAPLRIYRTGDRVRLLPGGELAFLGRLDDQVKIRGYRVELGEIVARLDRHPAVEASAVAVCPGSENSAEGAALAAYLVQTPGSKLFAGELREFLAAKLPGYMIPQHFLRLDALPQTRNGKLDKAALPAPTAQNTLPLAPSDAPAKSAGNLVPPDPKTSPAAGSRQREIAEMVAALLGQPSIRPEENFFMVGGHSMLGVQLVARIRDTFGVKLTLRQLFNAPTVAALSAEVDRLAGSPT